MTILALIPARGGSKGVPRKNILPVGGRPLLAWTIEAARGCAGISRVVLSTDDEEIARVGRAAGAEVPFLRPPHLATDTAGALEVILHALDWLKAQGAFEPDYVALLQPTSPLRTATDLTQAIALARAQQADSVISICPARNHPAWLFRLDAGGRMSACDPNAPTRRQDLEPLYAENGAIFLVKREVLQARRSWYAGSCLGYLMPEERSVDVDSPFELRIADLLLKDRQAR